MPPGRLAAGVIEKQANNGGGAHVNGHLFQASGIEHQAAWALLMKIMNISQLYYSRVENGIR